MLDSSYSYMTPIHSRNIFVFKSIISISFATPTIHYKVIFRICPRNKFNYLYLYFLGWFGTCFYLESVSTQILHVRLHHASFRSPRSTHNTAVKNVNFSMKTKFQPLVSFRINPNIETNIEFCSTLIGLVHLESVLRRFWSSKCIAIL